MPWIAVCDTEEVEAEDAVRFDHAERSYAVCMTDAGDLFCVDGFCALDGAHLAGGLVEGTLIECPDGGCLYDIRDGRPKGGPARATLAVYPTRLAGDRVEIDLPD